MIIWSTPQHPKKSKFVVGQSCLEESQDSNSLPIVPPKCLRTGLSITFSLIPPFPAVLVFVGVFLVDRKQMRPPRGWRHVFVPGRLRQSQRPGTDLFSWYSPWTFQPQSHSVYISPSLNSSVPTRQWLMDSIQQHCVFYGPPPRTSAYFHFTYAQYRGKHKG